jgi:uncharacterized membrane protein YbhN (UPF0104 family)
LALLGYSLVTVDREETWEGARNLGAALPVVLLPGVGWHLLRTAGWWVAFPAESRPSFGRVFRVRLAADAVSYFTVRGLASEPLRVILLLGHAPAAVSAAAAMLERAAVAISGVAVVGLVAGYVHGSVDLAPEWQRLFRGLALASLAALVGTLVFLSRHGRYLGPIFAAVHRRTGWRWTGGRAVRFITDVEALFLTLARTDHRRVAAIFALSLACYGLMIVEVLVIFWALGEPASLWVGTVVETFTRSASVLGGVIPANLGALEASNLAIANALGLAGGGSLALARRVRSLVWAMAGLALYPRDTFRVTTGGSP